MASSPPGQQLCFELRHHPALGREDFLQAPCNAEALTWIDRWPAWSTLFLYVYGPSGCGKTHLAHVFAARSGAFILRANELTAQDPFNVLNNTQALVIEDVSEATDEESLLHLYNSAKETGASILFTASLHPSRWAPHLPDLRSRILSIPCVEITLPDDTLLGALLIKLFSDRQLTIGQEALEYLLPRMERSFATAHKLVSETDKISLRTHRMIKIPLLREALNTLSLSCEELS